MTEPIAIVKDYDGLIEGLRARKAELGLTDKTVDALAFLADGHTGKLLGDCQVRTLGKISMAALLHTLGVKLIMVEDPEAVEQMRPYWEQRIRPSADNAKRLARIGETTKRRVFPVIVMELGSSGGKARMAGMSAAERQRFFRKIARKRWSKQGRRKAWQRKLAAKAELAAARPEDSKSVNDGR